MWSRDEGSKRFVRVRCPVPGPPRSESWLVPLPAAGSSGWLLYWFCGGHGPGETPGPFPNPEAKGLSRGDGTALERVWESSTPPHSTYGPSGRAPSGFLEVFFYSRARVFSSVRWRKTDAGRPVGGRIAPVAGRFGTLGIPGISRELPALIRWWDRLGNHALFRAQTLCRIEQNHVSRRSDGPADRRLGLA